MRKLLIICTCTILTILSCVPARKYQELQSKEEKSIHENTSLKTQNKELEEQIKEATVREDDYKYKIKALTRDTTVIGKSLRQMSTNYDQLNETYQLLLEKNRELLDGSSKKTKSLMLELQKTQDEIQQHEDALAAQDATLEKKEAKLQKMLKDLEAREAKVNELEAMIAKQDSISKHLKKIVQDALMGFKEKGLQITNKDGKVYVSLDEKLLFASGSYNVDEKGITILKQLSKILESEKDIKVQVEGHTDDVPYNGKNAIKDNWDLSVKRATSVVKILTSSSTIDPKRVTAAGRGEFDPINHTKTKDGRAKNRRTEIILSPRLDELYKIIED